MQRKIIYTTSDQQQFGTRRAARHHETNLVRTQRIEEFFAKYGSKAMSAKECAQAILKDPKEFARRISARAARRVIAKES